jgi:hypothetical protein
MKSLDTRVHDALTTDELLQKLADSDFDEIEPMLRATLKMVDGDLELVTFGEKSRGVVRVIELEWRSGNGDLKNESLSLPVASI